MGVGPDPELTNWSMRSGSVNFLTGKGYKEHHWLVIPHQPLQLTSSSPFLLCLLIAMLPLVSFLAWSTNLGLDRLPFMFLLKQGATPLKTMPSPPSCTMKRNTEYMPCLHCSMCFDLCPFRLLVMRKEWSTPQLTSSFPTPTPMTWIRTGSPTCTDETSSTP